MYGLVLWSYKYLISKSCIRFTSGYYGNNTHHNHGITVIKNKKYIFFL